jgi:hypothetical protein
MKQILSLALVAMLLMGLATEEANAQRYTRKKRYVSVGFSLSAMNYFGDITPQADFTSLRLSSTRPNLGINYTKRIAPRFSVRGNFFWGRITGDDAKAADRTEKENLSRYKRNLSFRNDIKELSVNLVVDLFENRSTYMRRPDFSPYGFIGFAVFHHNPKAYYDGSKGKLAAGWYALQPLGTEGQNLGGTYDDPYSRIQIAIPAGLGIRYKLDKHWDLAFEIGWRKTFTDYLDDVSTNYVSGIKDADGNYTKSGRQVLADQGGEIGEAAALLSDRSWQVNDDIFFDRADASYNTVDLNENGGRIAGFGGNRGEQRGDSSDDDWYIVTGFNLSYILNPNVHSPKFR